MFLKSLEEEGIMKFPKRRVRHKCFQGLRLKFSQGYLQGFLLFFVARISCKTARVVKLERKILRHAGSSLVKY